jgi:hypothetical protein
MHVQKYIKGILPYNSIHCVQNVVFRKISFNRNIVTTDI